MANLLIDKLKARENNQHILATYIDLSRVFDMIDNKILINKLEYYGMRGQSLGCSKVIYLIELNMYNIKVYLLISSVSHSGYHKGPLMGPPYVSKFTEMTCHFLLYKLKPYCLLVTPHCIHLQNNVTNFMTN